jgi:hypothetical protein
MKPDSPGQLVKLDALGSTPPEPEIKLDGARGRRFGEPICESSTKSNPSQLLL